MEIRPDITALMQRLRIALVDLYGERLDRVVLYGSHARGEAHADSDVDVLVVLHGDVDPWQEVAQISEAIYDLELETGELISLYPISLHRYLTAESPVLVNVHREGIQA